MAKETVICICKTCGKTFTRSAMRSSRKDAESWATWAVENITECDDCHQKRIEAERKQEEKELELPDLIGTEKQIAWAEKIRLDAIKNFNDFRKKALEVYENGGSFICNGQKVIPHEKAIKVINEIYEYMKNKTLCEFWIDNRDVFIRFSCIKQLQLLVNMKKEEG